MRRGLQDAQQNIAQFKNKVNSTLKGIATMVAAIGIGKAIKDSLDFYDYLSMQENRLAVIMRQRMGATDEMTKSIKRFISAQEALGVVGVEVQAAGAQELATYLELSDSLKTLIPVMNDMVVQQFGFKASGEQAVSIATMMGKVMDGQVGALSRYGYTFDAAQEKILKFGNEQQRAALLAEIVRDSLGNMNEAMANTPQGRAAKLANEFAGLKFEIGVTASIFRDIFMPVLSKVISFATAVAVRLQQVGLFFNALFGKGSISNTSDQTKATVKQTTAVGGLGNALETAGDKAKKAGKDAKGALAGFDEINQLADNSNSGAGSDGTGASADAGGDLSLPDTGAIQDDLPKISASVQALADKVRGYFNNVKGFLTGVGSFISKNKDIIISAVAGIAAGFAAFEIISKWSKIVKALQIAWEALSLAITGISWPIVAVAALIALFVGNLVYLWQTNEKFRDSVLSVWQQIKDFVIKVTSDMWSIVKGVWDKYGSDIVNGVGGFMKSIQAIILNLWESFLKPVMKSGLEMLSNLWDKHLKGLVAQVLDFVAKLVSSALEIWNKFISPIVNWLIQTFGPVFATVFSNIIKIIGTIVGAVADVAKGLFKALGGIVDFITGVFTGNWSKALNGLKDIFKGVFESLYAYVKAPLNLIIDAVNTMIGGLNKINIKAPDWVPGLGGKSFGIDIPKIPRLAKGGITNGPTLAMIGDNPGGHEIVSPLDKLSDIIASAVGTAIMQAMQYSKPSGSNGDILLNIDGRTFGRIIKPFVEMENQRVGNNVKLNPI
jgi:hypothetical protein